MPTKNKQKKTFLSAFKHSLNFLKKGVKMKKQLFKVRYNSKYATVTEDLTKPELEMIRKHPDTTNIKILCEYDLTKLLEV